MSTRRVQHGNPQWLNEQLGKSVSAPVRALNMQLQELQQLLHLHKLGKHFYLGHRQVI